VHHVQLQQPEIIREIYGTDVLDGLNRWMRTGFAHAEPSPISEFQTYGDYIFHRYPEKVNIFFHSHHLHDAREFKSKINGGIASALDPHLTACSCDFVTLINKHLLMD